MQNRADATPISLATLFAPSTEAKMSESASSSYALPDAPKETATLRQLLKEQIIAFCKIELEKIKNLVRKNGAQITSQKVYQLQLENFIKHVDRTDIAKSENNPLSETEIQQNIARLVYRFNSVNNLAPSIYSEVADESIDFTFLQDYLNTHPDPASTCLSLSRQYKESEIGFIRAAIAINELQKTILPEAMPKVNIPAEEPRPIMPPVALPDTQDLRGKTIADFLQLSPAKIKTQEHVHQLILLYCALSEARTYLRKIDIENPSYFSQEYVLRNIDTKKTMLSLQRHQSDTKKWPALFRKYIGKQVTVFEEKRHDIAGRLSYLQAIADITDPRDSSLQSTVRLFKQYPELYSPLLEKTKSLAKNIVETCEEYYSDFFPPNFTELFYLISDIRRFVLMTPFEDEYFAMLRYPKREAQHSIFENIALLKKIAQLPIEDYLNPAMWNRAIEIATRIISELKEVEAEEKVESEKHPDTISRLPEIKQLKQDILSLQRYFLRARTGVNDLVPAEMIKKPIVEIGTAPPIKQNSLVLKVSGPDQTELSEEAKQAQKKEADSLSWQLHVLRNLVLEREDQLYSDLHSLFKLDHPIIYNAIFRKNDGLLALASAQGAIDFMVLFLTMGQPNDSLESQLGNLSYLDPIFFLEFKNKIQQSGIPFTENDFNSLKKMIESRESLKATYANLKRRVEEKHGTQPPEKKPATGKRWITNAAATSDCGFFSTSPKGGESQWVAPSPPKALPYWLPGHKSDTNKDDEKMPQYNGSTLFQPPSSKESGAPPAAKLSAKEKALFDAVFNHGPS